MRPGWLILLFSLGVIPTVALCAGPSAPQYAFIPTTSYETQSAVQDQPAIRSEAGQDFLISAGSNPSFLLEFADVRDRTGTGFDDPQLGSARRQVAVSAFEQMSEILAGEPGSARVLVDSRSPWLDQQTLAIGIPLFQCIDGFQKPIIHDALRKDTHVHTHEGELLVNFNLPVSTSMEKTPQGQYDLYTMIFHEMVHILGFVGFSVESDGLPKDCGGARMLPAIAGYATDSLGNPLWIEQEGEILYLGNASDLPSAGAPILLDIPDAAQESLHLASGSLRVSGHWLPEDFEQRSDVLMLRKPFPSGSTRRNLTPETKSILETVLEYRINQEARGLSGAWVDSQLNGQGFTLSFIGKSRFIIYFYGFTDSGERLWMLGLHDGDFELGETITIPLIEAAGGQFNHLDTAQISELPWGELSIRFQDCLNAEATLSGIDGTQEMQLFPLARIDGLDCY